MAQLLIATGGGYFITEGGNILLSRQGKLQHGREGSFLAGPYLKST